MNYYWVVKGTARRNAFAAVLRPGAVETWITRAPPSRSWSEGDRVFLWESSPHRHLIGLGEIVRIHPRRGRSAARFDIRYLSRPFARPLGLDELRRDKALAGAAFLKAGPAATLLQLAPAHAARLGVLVTRANPAAKRVVAHWSANPDMLAISIRQPYVELILRGSKQFEYRSRPTNVRARVYIYAAIQPADDKPSWRQVGIAQDKLPTGVIVGTVAITGCQRFAGRKPKYGYVLERPQRLKAPLAPSRHPQPVWFRPF